MDKTKTCRYCGNQFRPRKATSKFCGMECYRNFISDEKKKNIKEFTCQQCGKVFEDHKRTNRKFCSEKCSGLSRLKLVKLKCQHCGVEFERPEWFAKQSKGTYCSVQCSNEHKTVKGKILRKCKGCQKEFEVSRSSSKIFCSSECKVKRRIIKTCLYCKRTFLASVLQTSGYCSKSCYSKGKYQNLENKSYWERVELTCQYCGKQFSKPGSRSNQKYCSRKCYELSTKEQFICQNCGKTFSVQKSQNQSKYCSRKCYFEYKRKNPNKKGVVDRICLQCGKTFKASRAQVESGGGKYCSYDCHNLAQTTKIIKTCGFCGKEFKVFVSDDARGNGLFCSKNCQGKAKKQRIECMCLNCGKIFEKTPSKIARGDGKYCSLRCAVAGKAPTDIEDICLSGLKKHGLIEGKDFIFQYDYPQTLYTIDFFFPDLKIAVEAQGIYWHSQPKIRERDKKRKDFLEKEGLTVLEWWGPDIKEDIDKLITLELLPCLT